MTDIVMQHIKVEGATKCPHCGVPVERMNLEPCVLKETDIERMIRLAQEHPANV